MEFLVLFAKTIALRPYVFVFLVVFLFASVTSMGLIRTMVFWLGTWLIAFLSEFSSTRTGFPYGWYQYTESTRGQELFVFNIPFMDSLSYSFLLFASFSLSLYTLAPLYGKGMTFRIADTFKIRQSWKVLILTALYMMMIDVVIDPVALQGEKWFLGKIYYYEYQGYYFGVPLSNALGWGIVGFVATAVYQTIEKRFLSHSFQDRGMRAIPFQGFWGVGLYYGVLAFNLGVTAYIEAWGLLIAGVFIYLLPTTILVFRYFDKKSQATRDEWQSHLDEFPPVLKNKVISNTGAKINATR
ncbi:MAG: carotenoid biosynthesis protein [Bdellovibrionales bacterium]|nr:carotenoid biosynthesis protein [Bdellovibrionales bacterium]